MAWVIVINFYLIFLSMLRTSLVKEKPSLKYLSGVMIYFPFLFVEFNLQSFMFLSGILVLTYLRIHIFTIKDQLTGYETIFNGMLYLIIIIVVSKYDIKLNQDLLNEYFLLFTGEYNLYSLKYFKLMNLYLFGSLLLSIEANYIVRTVLNRLKIISAEMQSNSVFRKSFNAGKLIGILERNLIYVFILSSEYSSIGFIIAAKAFARFKELEDRQFAEYVLCGTLLSVFLALLTSLLILQIRESYGF